MGKRIDNNGYWVIKHNPIARSGILQFAGRSLGLVGDAANQLYNVYRPAEELQRDEFLADFKEGLPLYDRHIAVGEGGADYDENPAQGVCSNPDFSLGKLYADIKVFSKRLMRQISSGKKELSIGYRSSFEKREGEFDGTPYSFVQHLSSGNHLALVDKGRAGPDIAVQDSDWRIVYDSVDITNEGDEQMENGDEFLDYPKVMKGIAGFPEDVKTKLMAVFAKAKYTRGEKDMSEEKKDEPSKDGASAEAAHKEEGKAINEAEKAHAKEGEAMKAGDADTSKKEESKEEKKEEKAAGDTAATLKSFGDSLEKLNARMDAFEAAAKKEKEEKPVGDSAEVSAEKKIRLVDTLKPMIGSFDSADMTLDGVSEYACGKLGITFAPGAAYHTLSGFLTAKGSPKKASYSQQGYQNKDNDPYFK